MRRPLHIDPIADHDLDEQAAYIGENTPATAIRFLEAAQETFEQLAEMPGIGSPQEYKNPRLAGVRVWRIRQCEGPGSRYGCLVSAIAER